MSKQSLDVDKILSNPDINWDEIIDESVQTNLSPSQKRDVRNLMIATAKVAALTTLKVIDENN